MRKCLLLGTFKFAHGVLDGGRFGQVVSVYLEQHLGNIRYVNRLHLEVALVANLQLELEQAVEFLPELKGLFTRELLEHEAYAVGEGSQSDVLLVLDGQGVKDLLLNLWEGFFDIVGGVTDDLRKLGDQFPLLLLQSW